MLKPRVTRKTAQKTVRIVEASLKPVSERVQQKTEKDATRIAEASLKASESFLDRTNYTINYRRKRALQEKSKKDYQERKRLRQRHVIYLRDLRKVHDDAKIARREDVELGPLAPKRDFGEMKDKFATASNQLIYPPELGGMDRKKEVDAIGENRFYVHDRVVVIRGREAGKIGTVTDVDNASLQLTVRGFGGVEYLQPDWMGKAQNDPRKYLPTNLKIRWRDVRLVVAAVVNEKGDFKEEPKMIDGEAEEFQDEAEELDNEQDQHIWTTKEFVLDHVDIRQRLVPARLHDTVRINPKILHNAKYEFNDAKRENPLLQEVFDDLEREPEKWSKGKIIHGYKWEDYRVIPGTNKEIFDLSKDDEEIDPSWDEGFDPEAESHPGDTVQYDVEEVTYRPLLTANPFPLSVLDELRNKHSRTAPVNRIDPAILNKKESKAAQIEATKILREEKMRTPLQEIKERRLDIEKQVLEKRKLSDDELFAKLGAAMERTFVSSGQDNRTEQYLVKMKEQKEVWTDTAAASKRAQEKAAWDTKLAEENKKQIEPSKMKGHLRYEKVADFWPADPKAREAQKAERRAEKEAALIADAKIKQFVLAKELLGQEQGSLAAKVQGLEQDVIAAERKRDLQKKGKGKHATPAVIARVPKLKSKLEKFEMEVVKGKTRKIERANRALDSQVEIAEKMKRQIIADAHEARRQREGEEKEKVRWV